MFAFKMITVGKYYTVTFLYYYLPIIAGSNKNKKSHFQITFLTRNEYIIITYLLEYVYAFVRTNKRSAFMVNSLTSNSNLIKSLQYEI